MENKVFSYITKEKMLKEGDKVVVGVSGGADSVCLLEILLKLKEKLKLEIVVVHIHHGIRGKDADADCEFVGKLCDAYKLKFYSYKFDVPTLAKKDGLSEEEEGRNLRYKCFGEVKEKENADKIAVAHNANDRAETVLLSMVRGSSVKGLAGIRAVRQDIIRPILCLRRDEIEEYLNKINMEFRTDITNLDSKYTRNKIRLNVLPELEKVNEGAIAHLNRLAEEFDELEKYLDEKTNEAKSRALTQKDGDVYLDIATVSRENKLIISRIVADSLEMVCGKRKDISARHIESVSELIKNDSGKTLSLPYGMEARNEYGKIIISNKKSSQQKIEDFELEQSDISVLDEGEDYLEISLNEVKFKLSAHECFDCEIQEKLYTKEFDYDKMKFGFIIRNRKDGDYINLKGGTKKLKDYFIDMKIPREKRDEILLIAKGSQIIWIVGYRINEEYKITKQTKRILKVDYYGGKNGR